MSGFLNPITVGSFQRSELSKVDWWGSAGPGNNSAIPRAYGLLNSPTVTDANSAIDTDADGVHFNQLTSASSGNIITLVSNPVMDTQIGVRFRYKFSLGDSGNLRFFVGIMDLHTGMPFDLDEPPTGYVGISFFTSRGDTNFVYMQAEQNGVNPETTISSVPITTDAMSAEITSENGTSFGISLYNASDTLLESVTLSGSSLPTTTANKTWGLKLENLGTVAKSIKTYYMWLGAGAG